MTASTIHLKLAGIDSEASASQHPDEIEVSSWTWGVAHTGAAAGGGGSRWRTSSPTRSRPSKA